MRMNKTGCLKKVPGPLAVWLCVLLYRLCLSAVAAVSDPDPTIDVNHERRPLVHVSSVAPVQLLGLSPPIADPAPRSAYCCAALYLM